MSANALIVSSLLVLVLAAAALRVATGPIVPPANAASLYAMGKFGPAPDSLAAPVEMAVSDARPGR
jgi:hypothetical protein